MVGGELSEIKRSERDRAMEWEKSGDSIEKGSIQYNRKTDG